MNIKLFLPLAIGAAGILSVPASAVNLVVNGSFETGSYTWDSGGADSLGVGSTLSSGWKVVNAEVAAVSNSNIWGLSAADGTVFIDLTGYHDSTPYGGLEQSFNTSVGQQYQVQFSIGINNSVSSTVGPASVDLLVNGSNVGTFTNSSTGSGQQWAAQSYSFTATSASTTLDLIGSYSAGGRSIGLDAVSVQAVPEPSSLILAAGSVLGLLGFRRRRS